MPTPATARWSSTGAEAPPTIGSAGASTSSGKARWTPRPVQPSAGDEVRAAVPSLRSRAAALSSSRMVLPEAAHQDVRSEEEEQDAGDVRPDVEAAVRGRVGEQSPAGRQQFGERDPEPDRGHV